MKIKSFHYRDVEESGWDFSPVEFGNLNLLVGDSATGKTLLLNTIFNLGVFAVGKHFKNGVWEIVFEHENVTYTWKLETKKTGDLDEPSIIRDDIWKHHNEESFQIVERDEENFIFSGKVLPKLSPTETSISLLQEEEIISPIYEAFSLIMRRTFSQDALSKISEFHAIPTKLLADFKKNKDLNKLFRLELNLSANLFILQEYFNTIYKEIVREFKKIFPFIKETRINTLDELNPSVAVTANVPIFSIRESGSNTWVNITEFSSGMKKVLLILTDIYLLPEGSVYIIDEYENSLGINAINFFPELMLTFEKDIQFIITSHHPYLINAIPPKNWYIFQRDGMHVTIRYGEELSQRFGISKQQAFIQLINDPFFSDGVITE